MNGFSYHLLPGRILAPSDKSLSLHNKAYQFWKNFWDKVFFDLDKTTACAEDFDRQSMIAVLMKDDEIIGMSLTTFFNVTSEASRNHVYFRRSYNDEFMKQLDQRHIHTVMSIEYLTVDHAHRKSQTGYSYPHVLVGLCLEMQKQMGIHSFVGASRMDLKVDRMVKDFGGITVQERSMHNVPVASMILPAEVIVPCPLPFEKKLIESLWAEKHTHWELNLMTQTQDEKKAKEAA